MCYLSLTIIFANIIYPIMLALIATLLAAVAVEGGNLRASNSPYLYAGNSFPVIEYMAKGRQSGGVDGEADFLYSTEQDFRLVEFYDKVDVDSINMRESYIQTAAIVTDQAKFQNASIDTYAVSCTAVPFLCEVQGVEIDRLPIVILYKPGSVEGVRLEKWTASDVLEKMGLTYDDKTEKATEFVEKAESHPMRTLEELKADIHLSFDTAMRHHVFGGGHFMGPLPQEKHQALKNWLLLIHKTIPPAWHIHAIVKELINSFMYIAKNKAYMVAILDSNKPTVTEYSKACSQGHVAGLTCGAWEMMHAVTVGVVEYNKMGMSENKDRMSTEAAARIIRDYIYQFGMGDDLNTKGHFLQHADACQESHCLQPKDSTSPGLPDWIQLPLWMSKTHNDINLIIQEGHAVASGRRRTLLQHVATAWPPRTHCPACWSKAGKWNEEVVYKYLQMEYTQVEELTPEARDELFGMPLPTQFRGGLQDNPIEIKLSSAVLLAIGLLVAKFLFVQGRTLSTAKSD